MARQPVTATRGSGSRARPEAQFARGEHLIWLTGSALGICLLMILRPARRDPCQRSRHLLAVADRAADAEGRHAGGRRAGAAAGDPRPRASPDHLKRHRVQLKVGNRDLYGVDFRWIDEDADRQQREQPAGLFLVERSEYGPLIGDAGHGSSRATRRPRSGAGGGRGAAAAAARRRAAEDRAAPDGAREGRDRRRQLRARADPPRARASSTTAESRNPRATSRPLARGARQRARQDAQARYAALEEQARAGRRTPRPPRGSSFRTVDGQEKELRALDVYRAYPANALSWAEPCRRSTPSRLWSFLADEPREANTEGGIFPAHLRHRDDGVPDEPGGRAVRRARRALPARVREAGAARAHGAHRRQQPGRRALDRVRRLRPRLLRLLRRRRHRPRSSSPRRCRRPPTAPAASSGPR